MTIRREFLTAVGPAGPGMMDRRVLLDEAGTPPTSRPRSTMTFGPGA